MWSAQCSVPLAKPLPPALDWSLTDSPHLHQRVDLLPQHSPLSHQTPPRVGRACDACRKHKVKCHLEEVGACENCLRAGRPCTFKALSVKRDRPPTKRDVDKLNFKIKKLENILAILAPNFDLKALPRTANQARNIVRKMNDRPPPPPPPPLPPSETSPSSGPHSHASPSNLTDRSPNDLMSNLKCLANLRISTKPSRTCTSFSGRSSVDSASGSLHSPCTWIRGLSDEIPFSTVEAYMEQYADVQALKFCSLPPPALADSLVDLFFENVNPYENLLHKGEFMRLYRSGLADSHVPFRGLCFAIFAAASRFSSDPRVYPVTPGDALNKQAAGALFLYSSISLMAPDCVPCTLYDLQSMAVLCYATCCLCSPLTVWSSVASHLRRAQAAGAHRENVPYWKASVMTDHLRKKAVWYLATVELRVSSSLGRTTALKHQELDLDFPLAVDDETLTRIEATQNNLPPLPALESLPGAASQRVWGLMYSLKKRFGLSLQRFFSVRSSPDFRVWNWDRTAVLALAADLDAYFEQNLASERWDPNTTNLPHLMATAQMRCATYGCQILIHRLLISDDSSQIAVCLKASSALIDILDHIRSRGLLELTAAWSPYLVTPPALTLLFVARGKYDCMLPMDRANAWAGVHRCINILNALAPNHFLAEQLSVSVQQLVQVCIEEELFMSTGQRTIEKKREVSDVCDRDNPIERKVPLTGTSARAIEKLAGSDWSADPTDASEVGQPQPEFRDDRLTLEDIFGIPHSQLDAFLFESPGKTLMPGFTSGGSPEWLDFAAPSEALLAAGSCGVPAASLVPDVFLKSNRVESSEVLR